MPLFDALQNISQGAPQPDLGGALTQQIPGMGPPASQAEFNQRKQGWSAALQNPALMSGLFQFGLALMSPGAVGQTSTGHIANALGAGANAVTATQQLQQKNQLAQQEEARKTRSSDAQADLAKAYTRKADDERATAPLKARREAEQHELNMKRLDVQIKALEAQGRKAEADILRIERDSQAKVANDKVETEYKRALTAESLARAKNVNTNTKSTQNQWTESSSKISDGQTLIRRHNKATNESETYILTKPNMEQIDDAIWQARQDAKERGEVFTADDQERIRAEMSTPKIERVNLPPENAPMAAPGVADTGDPGNLTPEEARALGVTPKTVSGPASPAKPSQGKGPKADFHVSSGARVTRGDGTPFNPTTAGQEFKEGLARAKEELFEFTQMRNNEKNPADRERLTKRIEALKANIREKYGAKAARTIHDRMADNRLN